MYPAGTLVGETNSDPTISVLRSLHASSIVVYYVQTVRSPCDLLGVAMSGS